MLNFLGGPRKTRKRSSKNTSAETVNLETDFTTIYDSQSTPCSLQSTPKRGKRQTKQIQEAFQISPPSTDNLFNTSTSPLKAEQAEPEHTKLITDLKVFNHIFTDQFLFLVLVHRFLSVNVNASLYFLLYLFCHRHSREIHHAANQTL